jgi:steroid 5-alpha reductase family enzyme
MAEQDIYGGRMSPGPVPVDRAAERLSHGRSEQDIYGQHFSQTFDRARDTIRDHIPHPGDRGSGGGSGAEQDLYGSRFGNAFDKARQNIPHVGERRGGASTSGAEQDLYGSHFHTGSSVTALGLVQGAVLPSFTFHAAFSTIAYGVSRYTGRAEGKDWFWPTGMTLNAWWSAIGARVLNDGLSVSTAWSTLTYSEKLLLGGVTAWGGRLLYRIASRGIARGRDDPRYDAVKKDPGFWNKALYTMFWPEAVVQTLISLPFVLPFRAPAASIEASPVTANATAWHSLAVFLFSTGFAIEVLADAQLARHKKSRATGICRDNVWSIVRHPNYLGDALIHASFPILLIGAGLFHPLAALGPIANYIFLRFISGDRENEQTQAERYEKEDPLKAVEFRQYREEKNSFWPNVREVGNKWSWVVIAAGVAGVVLERGVRSVLA